MYTLDQVPRLIHTWFNGMPPAQEPMEIRPPSDPARGDDSVAEMIDFERAWPHLDGYGPKLLFHLYGEEQTQTDAAEMCGLPHSTAQRYHDRAMTTLLQALNDKNFGKDAL